MGEDEMRKTNVGASIRAKVRQAGAEKARWDLSRLYSGIDDPQIDNDLASLVEMAKNFSLDHKGRLAKTLGQAILDYSEIEMLGSKIFLYSGLARKVNVDDPAIKAKIADLERSWGTASGEYLVFFEIELAGLDDSVLADLYAKDQIVAGHKSWIEHVRVFKPHFLSEQVEAALAKRSSFGSGAWSDFFTEFQAHLGFRLGRKKLTLSEIMHVMSESQDAEQRFEAMAGLNKGLSGAFAKYSAQTLYMVAGSGGVEAGERSYKHPMDMRNKSNRVTDEMVFALHKAVREIAGPLARRFYRLKAEHLGLKVLRWSDRNAPLPFSDTSVTPFNQALTMVTEAYRSFSPTLAGLIGESVKAGRIDAPAIKGKDSGAFNNSVVLPGGKPVSFTFLNYLGSGRDVMILAHELGHSVHGLLAGEAQGPLMFQAPIAYCETASVFGEMTAYDFLKNKMLDVGDKKSLLATVIRKIDDILNTVVRQIGFSNFEQRVHGIDPGYLKWYRSKKHSVEELDGIWAQTLKELYGEEGDIFTYQNTEHLWAYVPHFHWPFYVYGYAFGEVLAQSLHARKPELGEKFEPLYLEMLRSGATRSVTELLEPFGLNPADENFWADGIRAGLGSLVEEAEKLS